MEKKVLVLASSFLDELLTHPESEGEAVKVLRMCEEQFGVKVEYRVKRNPLEKPSPEEFHNVCAVIADLEKYDEDLLSSIGPKHGGSLGLIARYGTGCDAIDLGAATENGIIVTNTPGVNALPTAEWAVSTLLDVAGRRAPHHEASAIGKAKQGPSRLDVSGRTLGIIGTGYIGKTVASLMSGFNMNVLAGDIQEDNDWAKSYTVTYTDIMTICREADFITLHVSANEEILGKKEINVMKPTTVLVNCARGLLVDNRYAYKAVRKGQLYGYGMDEVWTYEDLPLRGLNIAVSPHVGSDTDMGKVNMQLHTAQAVESFLAGNHIENVVNTEVLNNRGSSA